jgi:acyl carrier protein
MDSMQAMHLSGDLADWLGQQLSPTVVWDYPTIELLASHLAGSDQ